MLLFEPKEAVKRVCRGLENLGYMLTSKSRDTRYYTKMGTHLKVRVSDHGDQGRNDDVITDVVISSKTIQSDITYRIKQADRVFTEAVRNAVRRKKAS